MRVELKLTVDNLLPFYASYAAGVKKTANFYSRLFAADSMELFRILEKNRKKLRQWVLINSPLGKIHHARMVYAVVLREQEKGTLLQHFNSVAKLYFPGLLDYINDSETVVLEEVTKRSLNRKNIPNTEETLLLHTLAILFTLLQGRELAQTRMADLFAQNIYIQQGKTKKMGDRIEYTEKDKENFVRLRKKLRLSVLNSCNLIDLNLRNSDPENFYSFNEIANLLAEYWGVDETECVQQEQVYREWIELVLKHMSLNNRFLSLPDDILHAFFLLYLKIFLLAKTIDDQREYFFKHGKEMAELYMKAVQQEAKLLRTENKKLLQEKEKLEKELSENRRKKELLQEIAGLKQEIRVLNKKLEEEKEKNQELFALRELVFSLQEQAEDEQEESVILDIPPVRCVVVGGTDRWQRELREYLPDTFRFVGYDARNFDISVLRGAEIVFIYPRKLSHTVYYRVIENMPENSRMIFIPYQNIRKVISFIADQIQNT